jgi:hypothetical protein
MMSPSLFVAKERDAKRSKDKPLSVTQERRNRRIAKARARVEDVFAGLAQLGGKALRSIGLASGR